MGSENKIYTLEFEEEALKDIKILKEREIPAYNKVIRLLEELRLHPETGIGKPELLKHAYSGLYSRRITQKDRLIYKVNYIDNSILIISAFGHYSNGIQLKEIKKTK